MSFSSDDKPDISLLGRNMEAYLAGVLDSAMDAIITVDAQRLSRIGYWDVDLTTGLIWWSDEVYEIFGVDRALLGLTDEGFLRRIHPDDRAAYINKPPAQVAGLPCLVVGDAESLADDLAAYLKHAGALVKRGADIEHVGEWIAGCPPGLNLFRHRKTRYKGLSRNTAQLFSLFGFANLMLARRWLLGTDTQVAS